jgi:fructosamine-3-kinase
MTDVGLARAAVTALTDRRVTGARALTGAVFRVHTDSGPVLAKRGIGRRAVAAETASLRWLTDARAVPVPEVLGHDGDWLVATWIEQGPATQAAAEELGHGLAALHASGATAFGQAPPDGPADAWIGSAAMADVPGPSWPEWFAEHRIAPYLRRCVDAGTIDHAAASVIERVGDRLPDLAGPAEPPARLHGDLWNGNVLWSAQGSAWLIDPAAHGGHRETDLAMLALFGCPHLDRVRAAYQETAPLADGWRDRIPLHQLFPLLVHTELFGGGYAGQAVAAAHSALAHTH